MDSITDKLPSVCHTVHRTLGETSEYPRLADLETSVEVWFRSRCNPVDSFES